MGLLIAAASCAADLADPAQYTAARNLEGGSGSPSMTGGTGASGGTPTAGGTAGGMGGGMVPPVPACAQSILVTCTACHNTGAVGFPALSGSLDLSGDNVGIRLKDAPATNAGVMGDKSGCGMGALLINSTTNAESVMLKRIKGTQGTCGSRMPTTGPLPDAEIKCLEDWIMAF